MGNSYSTSLRNRHPGRQRAKSMPARPKPTKKNLYFLYKEIGLKGLKKFLADYPTRRRLTQLKKCEDSSPKGRRLTGAELLAQHRQRNPYRDSVVLTRLLDEIKRAQQ